MPRDNGFETFTAIAQTMLGAIDYSLAANASDETLYLGNRIIDTTGKPIMLSSAAEIPLIYGSRTYRLLIARKNLPRGELFDPSAYLGMPLSEYTWVER